MAIVINGSGTVTGLAVGGLPDGIVDSGTLATNSVDSAELVDGAVDDSHIAALAASKLTGALPAISGASLTNLPAITIRNHSLGAVGQSTTSNTWVDSGLTLTITPASANSYFYVEVFHVEHINESTPNYGGASRIIAGSTEIVRGGQLKQVTNSSNISGYNGIIHNYGSFYDPSTTSAIVFKAQVVSANISSSHEYHWQWGHDYIEGSVMSPRLRITEFL